eukprot:152754-Chlamydomonas_euryale.AAC.11
MFQTGSTGQSEGRPQGPHGAKRAEGKYGKEDGMGVFWPWCSGECGNEEQTHPYCNRVASRRPPAPWHAQLKTNVSSGGSAGFRPHVVWGGSGPCAIARPLWQRPSRCLIPLPCYARHRHTLRGSAPCNSDSVCEEAQRKEKWPGRHARAVGVECKTRSTVGGGGLHQGQDSFPVWNPTPMPHSFKHAAWQWGRPWGRAGPGTNVLLFLSLSLMARSGDTPGVHVCQYHATPGVHATCTSSEHDEVLAMSRDTRGRDLGDPPPLDA